MYKYVKKTSFIHLDFIYLLISIWKTNVSIFFVAMLNQLFFLTVFSVFLNQVTVARQSGMIFTMIDPRMGSYPPDCIEKFASLALRCVQDETDARPSMAEVVTELEAIWRMTPEADNTMSESIATESIGKSVPPSSSLDTRNSYLSSDVSGSNLISGAIPTIAPR